MGLPVLIGPRIKLRKMMIADAANITAALQSWDVMQWLTAPPYPYTQDDALAFIDNCQDDVWAIDLGGALIGSIGELPELGYWLAAGHHGQGIMQEAARLVVDWHFATSKSPIVSGHFLGNGPSRGVLLKLGFQDTQQDQQFSKPLNKDITHQCMSLTQQRWQSLRTTAQ